METVIYYFSGTGNSLYAAKKFHECIVHSELRSIVKSVADKHFSDDAQRIVFVFPLYYLSFPKIVMDFIARYQVKKGSEVVCVATRGFPPMGGVIRHFRNIMRKKGVEVRLGFYLDMPSNDVILFGLQTKEKQLEILQTIDGQINGILKAISGKKKYLEKEPFGLLRYVRHKSAYLKKLPKAGRKFFAQEACTGCGVCSKVCPMDNVHIVDIKPKWGSVCQLCEACINYCPQRAIQYGNRSVNRERYVNPNVTQTEIEKQK